MTSAIRAAIIEGRRLHLGHRDDGVIYPVAGLFPCDCCFDGYSNTVIGATRFSGMEVIREMGVPVWSMAYSGGMVHGYEGLEEDAYAFLRRVLELRVKTIRFPGKERASYSRGGWYYRYFRGHGYDPVVCASESVCYSGQRGNGVDNPIYTANFIFTDIVDNRR